MAVESTSDIVGFLRPWGNSFKLRPRVAQKILYRRELEIAAFHPAVLGGCAVWQA